MKLTNKTISFYAALLCLLSYKPTQATETHKQDENPWKSTCSKFIRGSHWSSAIASIWHNNLYMEKVKVSDTQKPQSFSKYYEKIPRENVDAAPQKLPHSKAHVHLAFDGNIFFVENTSRTGGSPKIFADFFDAEPIIKAFSQTAHKQYTPSSWNAGSIAIARDVIKNMPTATQNTSNDHQSLLQALNKITAEDVTLGYMFRFESNFRSTKNNFRMGMDLPFLLKSSFCSVSDQDGFDALIANIRQNFYLNPDCAVTKNHILGTALLALYQPKIGSGFGDLRFYIENGLQKNNSKRSYKLLVGIEGFYPMQKPDTSIPNVLRPNEHHLSLEKISNDAANLYSNPQNATYHANITNDSLQLIGNFVGTINQTLTNTQHDLFRSGIGCYVRPSVSVNNGQGEIFASIRGAYLLKTNQIKIFNPMRSLENYAVLGELQPTALFQFNTGYAIGFGGTKVCMGYDLYLKTKEGFHDIYEAFATEASLAPSASYGDKFKSFLHQHFLHQHSFFSSISHTMSYAEIDICTKIGCCYNLGLSGGATKSYIPSSVSICSSTNFIF
jgi:hypothetical protein